MKLYHGSENLFTEFNFSNVGKNALYAGFGYYFSSSKIFASHYASGEDTTLFGYDIYFNGKKYNFNPILKSWYTQFFNTWHNYRFHINFEVENFNYKNHFINWCQYGLSEIGLSHKLRKAIESLYKRILKTELIEVKLPKYLYDVEVETSKVYYLFSKAVANQIVQQLKRENSWNKEIQSSIFSLIGKKIFNQKRKSELKQILIQHLYSKEYDSMQSKIYSDEEIFRNNIIERKISMFFHRCGINGFAFRVEDVYDYCKKENKINYEFLIFDKKSIKIK